MTDVTVYRGGGTNCLPTITEEILSTDEAAKYRGRQEMEEHAQQYMVVDMTILHRTGLGMAQCIRVAEHIHSPYMYQKITDISYNITNQNVTVKLTTRRPTR